MGRLALVVTLVLLLPATVFGQVLLVEAAWSRATPPVSDVGVAYFVVHNPTAERDRIIGIRSPVAGRAKMHTTTMVNGVMKMRPTDVVEVLPGDSVSFEPGGRHVMLMGLGMPLKEGDRFPLTVRFERAPPVTVEVTVMAAGAM